MNKPEMTIRGGVQARRLVVDKSEFRHDPLVARSWNAYCLAKRSDRFVCTSEG